MTVNWEFDRLALCSEQPGDDLQEWLMLIRRSVRAPYKSVIIEVLSDVGSNY